MNFLRTLTTVFALLLCASTALSNDKNSGAGTVAETMTSGGYVYVRLEEDNTWIASSTIPVAVGDKIKYSGGMTMKDFTSRTLNRTFDYILFAGKIEVDNPFNADAHAAAAASNHQGIDKSAAAIPPVAGDITPLDGGKTIADIRAGSGQLKDQQTSLRARVMKVSEDILGKNWITLQDGTGTAPDNKLLATSAELVEIGALVTVTGTVKTDVDLGSGYKYKVVLEEATFTQ